MVQEKQVPYRRDPRRDDSAALPAHRQDRRQRRPALGQLTLYVGVGLIGLSLTKFRDLIPAVAGGGGWFLLFFIVGFAALACLWAMAGAMATRSGTSSPPSAPISTSLMVALFAGSSSTVDR